jgi:hypothetical protein
MVTMETGFDYPGSGFFGGLPGDNVIVNIIFDVIVNLIGTLERPLYHNLLKSLDNKFLVHFAKKFTLLLKFLFLGSIYISERREIGWVKKAG